MRSKYIDIVLLVAGIMAILLAIKTSGDIYPWEKPHPFIESIFDQFQTGNEIVFSLSVGSAVSVLFYFLIVWYPEKRKRYILMNSLREYYHRFRLSTISILLLSCNKVCEYSLVKSLTTQKSLKSTYSNL